MNQKKEQQRQGKGQKNNGLVTYSRKTTVEKDEVTQMSKTNLQKEEHK